MLRGGVKSRCETVIIGNSILAVITGGGGKDLGAKVILCVMRGR